MVRVAPDTEALDKTGKFIRLFAPVSGSRRSFWVKGSGSALACETMVFNTLTVL